MPAKPLDREGLMNYAAYMLAGRAQSLSELRLRLKKRAAREEDVAEVLAALKEAGFVNDQRFADSFVNWRRENQGLGKTRVLRDLMARRVAPEVARKAVDRGYAEVDEVALIETFLEKKCRGKDLTVAKNLASVYRKLRGAGFSPGNSIRVLKRHAAAAEQLEDMEDASEA
jgi:regulatory protein